MRAATAERLGFGLEGRFSAERNQALGSARGDFCGERRRMSVTPIRPVGSAEPMEDAGSLVREALSVLLEPGYKGGTRALLSRLARLLRQAKRTAAGRA
jgi:hypothetical protein